MSYISITHVLPEISDTSNPNTELPQRLFNRKQLIPLDKNVLWRIERGAVRTLTWSEEGMFITLGYWGAGDVIGYCLSKVQPYQIECLSSVEVSMIQPHLWYRNIDAFVSHIQQSEELLSIVHVKPISLRLSKLLIWLSAKFGCDVPQGKLIDLNITHQEMSEVLNTTRVTITRLLQQFEEQGALLRYKRRIIIISTDKLISSIV